MDFVMLIASDRLGAGDDDLGRLLMRNFLYSLARDAKRPGTIVLMNSGVRLACEGSGSVDDLRLLAEEGTAVLACGTCLDFLKLQETLAVGEVGRMPDAVALLAGAAKVVTLG